MSLNVESMLHTDDFFDQDLIADAPYLDNFLYSKNLLYFSKLFKKICSIVDMKQDDLSKLSKKKYSRMIEKSIINPGTNVGSLSQDAISRAQLGSFRPTQQQIYFWFSVLKQCLQELDLEVDPEIEEAFYILSLGGTPQKVDWAIKHVQMIEEIQQTITAQVIEQIKAIEKVPQLGIIKSNSEDEERNTDVHLHCLPSNLQELSEPQY